MHRLTLGDFKSHKLFVILTVVLAFLIVMGSLLKPEYYDVQSSFVLTVMGALLGSWWFQHFWNNILIKFTHVPQISYGVALFLTAAVTVLIG